MFIPKLELEVYYYFLSILVLSFIIKPHVLKVMAKDF